MGLCDYFTLFILYIIPPYVDLCECVYHSANYINTHWLVQALCFPVFPSLCTSNVCSSAAWASPIENYGIHTHTYTQSYTHTDKKKQLRFSFIIWFAIIPTCWQTGCVRHCTGQIPGDWRGREIEEEREGNSLVLQTLPSLWSYPRARRFKWGGHGPRIRGGFYGKSLTTQ